MIPEPGKKGRLFTNKEGVTFVDTGTEWLPLSTSHPVLTDLEEDSHPQYLNEERHDNRDHEGIPHGSSEVESLAGAQSKADNAQIAAQAHAESEDAAHVVDTDPHGDRAYAEGYTDSAITDHEAAADPHTQYVQTVSDEDLVITDSSKGLILEDRTEAKSYRLYVDNGILSVEEVV